MTALTELTLTAMRAGLAAREFSARELTTAHLEAAEAARALNAFITLTPDHALAAAEAADAALARGAAGPLAGIPIGHKDLFATAGIRTTAASRMLADFVPTYESTVTARLLAAGAVPIGKLNLDEFAMGSSNESSAFGPVVSPWRAGNCDEALVPGGSSGGSAAAVAARLVAAATGTDTGGSIRQPAAFCGVVGIKPTYGRCSRFGIVAFASSLDQAGVLARTVADAAVVLEAMAGFDPRDSTSLPEPVPPWSARLSADLTGRRVGIPVEYRADGMDEAVERLWAEGARWLQDAGAQVVDVSLPHTAQALPAYYVIAPAEASSNLARYDGVRYGLRVVPEGGGLMEMYEATRAAGFGPEVRRRILIGTYVLSAGYYDAYYAKAQRVRTLIARDFAEAFRVCDLLLAPTAPTGAFPLGAKSADPIAMYLNDVFTVPASLAGLPAISVPAGLDARGLPLGLQLIGRPLDEQGVLDAALAIETRAGFCASPARWWGDDSGPS
ncbi:MAG: Asp-tRNA(Asn)/Glu-tRNA(Gln) amidotransferase subunit GatA [Sphingomonadaceae bacterium]|uniref:Asp-tRNA(Asn)/Glu-tRNA(Gln) amidotransferase subunit GatA n=1 Tax=Thermaurantiacus sp. TaxID=2820283 RepID=UPI00298F3B6C|nr:Asp-tRNA(Asn)/Glu-tRNA(Gln) amidotransferase subunit GatA [Thermaurantiacus sp.]MCS6987039.1 Asp-tRNA(Asn)/Glu-tRNA(Gln) amidotransferase subunit GatA [Sphingomonadaceae bacterium]MDW8415623.1 Asp-tRNA(Asn)/Glu-tRNA(Gln) amidotransferase subunit GatA [Thermaurantiacus sp.]